jgi:hypothetical protein
VGPLIAALVALGFYPAPAIDLFGDGASSAVAQVASAEPTGEAPGPDEGSTP